MGVTFATGRPRLVMRMPSAGRPSNNCKHCSRKSLTFSVFISQVYRRLYISEKSLNMVTGSKSAEIYSSVLYATAGIAISG